MAELNLMSSVTNNRKISKGAWLHCIVPWHSTMRAHIHCVTSWTVSWQFFQNAPSTLQPYKAASMLLRDAAYVVNLYCCVNQSSGKRFVPDSYSGDVLFDSWRGKNSIDKHFYPLHPTIRNVVNVIHLQGFSGTQQSPVRLKCSHVTLCYTSYGLPLTNWHYAAGQNILRVL